MLAIAETGLINYNRLEMKQKKYLSRRESIITGKRKLESLYTFPNFPVFMGCTDEPFKNDLFADMEWVIDPGSGMIQLKKLLPLETLYKNQHNDGTGKVWNDLYSEFAKFLVSFKPQKVLEIGGAHDRIAQNYLNKVPQASWTLVEPHPAVKDKRIKVVKKWFDDKFTFNQEIDTLVHSHFFEHLYNPVQFLETVYKFLKPGQNHAFAIPKLHDFLKKKFTNALNFEHTFFLTEYFMDYLLQKTGFKIVKKQTFGDNHSIFYLTRKDKSRTVKLRNKYKSYKKIFMNFVNFHLDMVKRLNKLIVKSKEPVYLFGAHIFSQYLIGFGLKTDKIVSVLDNSPMKQGKRLYGTKFIVESTGALKGKGKTHVILKAGPYNAEIKKDILENINSES